MLYKIKDIHDLTSNKSVVVSGGFDPIHVGHVRMIQEAHMLAVNLGCSGITVIANSDEWLIRKKGKVFMPLAERMEILAAITGVYNVVVWDDGSPDVCGALRIIKPTIFANGGDRDNADGLPEKAVGDELGINMVFNVGGGKVQSSSWLTGMEPLLTQN